MPDDCMADPTTARLRALEAAVEGLRVTVARLQARQAGRHDPRLGALLTAVYAFSGASPWTAGELILDARRAQRRDLLVALDAIVRDADGPRTLGRFCRRHDGAVVAGLRLERVKRLWIVSEAENDQ